MSHRTSTARACLRVAAILDQRGDPTRAATLRREVLAQLADELDDGEVVALARACAARDDLPLLSELLGLVLAKPRWFTTRAVLAAAFGRRGDVATVARLVGAATSWRSRPVTLDAGLTGLVERGVPDDADEVEAQLLPLARELRAEPGERWENAAHAAGAGVYAETSIATALALLGRESRARALYEALLASAPSRAESPVARADRHAWCASVAAAAGDGCAHALLAEADHCIDRVDDDDDIDGYTARLRQRIDDARHQVRHLEHTRREPLGRRSLRSASKHVPLPASFRRFGEMDYAAERRAKLRARIEGCAQVGLLPRALDVLAEAEADGDLDVYQRSDLVGLTATALTAEAELTSRERLLLAARRVPDAPRGGSRELPRAAALAGVALALTAAGHHEEALRAARESTGWHRQGALLEIALTLLGARRDAEARAVLDELEPIDPRAADDLGRYRAELVARSRELIG